jgi:hypothetical protein
MSSISINGSPPIKSTIIPRVLFEFTHSYSSFNKESINILAVLKSNLFLVL